MRTVGSTCNSENKTVTDVREKTQKFARSKMDHQLSQDMHEDEWFDSWAHLRPYKKHQPRKVSDCQLILLKFNAHCLKITQNVAFDFF